MTRKLPAAALTALTAVAAIVPPTAHAAVGFANLVTGVSAPTAFVDPPDGLPHRFVAQQDGRVRVWSGSGTTVNATPFLDLRDEPPVPVGQQRVLDGGERGLLAMAVHPNYATNGYVYLYYTSIARAGLGIGAGDIVVERYTRSANPEVGDPASAHIVLVVSHPADNHNGGDLKFGPDGYLYVTLGDGGGGCDSVAESGQDATQLLGKMLRLDVDGADAYPGDALRNYAIPVDNPLVGFTGADEIWALGLRNPFRFTFDRSTGDAYIGDVGQDDWEEINYLPKDFVSAGNPANFGWPCREGYEDAGCGNSSAIEAICSNPPTFVEPVRAEPNPNGQPGGSWQSIMAGYRYRGGHVAADLGGLVVYGDAAHGDVWAAVPAVPIPWPASELATDKGPYGFAEDQGGELYVLAAGSSSIECVQTSGGTPCTAWASLGDIFLDGFDDGTDDAWVP